MSPRFFGRGNALDCLVFVRSGFDYDLKMQEMAS